MSIGNIAATTPRTPEHNEPAPRRTRLWVHYLIAVIIPVIGLILAVQLAVMDRYRDVRRHAIGVAVTSVGMIVVWLALSGVFSSSHSDSNVARDLNALLTQHGVLVTGRPQCSHASGNTYTCWIHAEGRTVMGTVTDDGHAITWQPN